MSVGGMLHDNALELTSAFDYHAGTAYREGIKWGYSRCRDILNNAPYVETNLFFWSSCTIQLNSKRDLGTYHSQIISASAPR